MFGTHFYHERVRKSVAIFGSLFNNLYVICTSGGNTVSQQKVPLAYAPQRKFLERINESLYGENEERQLAVKLPRMSFEMVNMQYDAQRQLPKMNYFQKEHVDNQGAGAKWYVATPYICTFDLNIYAKNHDDALQIVEQILPYFAPQYTVSVKPVADYPDIVEDVPVILTTTAFSDDFEGPMENSRTIIYTLTFDMKVSFYGPKPPEGAIIKRIDVDFWNMEPEYYLETLVISQDSEGGDFDYDIIDILRPFKNPEIRIYAPHDSDTTFDLRTNDIYDSGSATYFLMDSDQYDTPVANYRVSTDGILSISPTSIGLDRTKYKVINPRTDSVVGICDVVIETTVDTIGTQEDETDVEIIALQDHNDSDESFLGV